MAESTQQIILDAPGINCGHCEAKIRQAGGVLPGVQGVGASNMTKTVNIEYQPDSISLDTIRTALARAGYPAQN